MEGQSPLGESGRRESRVGNSLYSESPPEQWDITLTCPLGDPKPQTTSDLGAKGDAPSPHPVHTAR